MPENINVRPIDQVALFLGSVFLRIRHSTVKSYYMQENL